jgi:hypothetical protein
MNRTHLRRIVALEAKFPPPMPDWSHLNVDELHDLKMLLVRRFKKIRPQLPLPFWIAEALDCETPKQRVAARIAAGLNPMLSTFFGKPRLAPDRKQSDAVDRKRAVECLPSPPNEPSDQLPWTAKTIANRRRRIRGNRRPRRASRG